MVLTLWRHTTNWAGKTNLLILPFGQADCHQLRENITGASNSSCWARESEAFSLDLKDFSDHNNLRTSWLKRCCLKPIENVDNVQHQKAFECLWLKCIVTWGRLLVSSCTLPLRLNELVSHFIQLEHRRLSSLLNTWNAFFISRGITTTFIATTLRFKCFSLFHWA